MIRRKILYLNVNGFLGNKNKNNIIKKYGIGKLREAIARESLVPIEERTITTYPKEVVEEISRDETMKDVDETMKDVDMVFLSEVDPYSWATDIFIKEMNEKGYEVLWPYAGYSEKIIQAKKLSEDKKSEWRKKEWEKYSCTMCLKKKGADYTNCENGFDDKQDYLHFCKIKNQKVVLLAIHCIDEERIKYFMESIKRLLQETYNPNIIVCGDTNADPDAKQATAAFEYSQNFEKFMKELGLHEIEPKEISGEIPKTFGNPPITRIDRVFTNMSNVKVYVKPVFAKNNLSDHEALLITYEED